MRLIAFFVSALSAALPAVAPAQAPAEPVVLTRPTAADFGALPFMNFPEISPDGSRMAARGHVDGRTVLIVSTLSATQTTSVTLPSPPDHQLDWYRWAGNGKLLVSISRLSNFEGEEVRLTRVVVMDIATHKSFIAGPKAQGVNGGDNVPMSQSRRLHEALAKAGKAHDYVIYEGEGHGFEKPENSIDFLVRVGRFLDLHNPA